MLTFFNSEEGYIEPQFDPVNVIQIIGFDYTWQYKDHLGNIRLSYQDLNGNGTIDPLTEIKEENHYYPFGLKHKGYNNQITGRDHNYGYNGIEESNELGFNMLEMDLRQYDPTIARWVVLDPIVHYDYSPYQAFDNNPIFWADPSGADSQTDIFGRDRFDSNGLYIRPGDRGESETSPFANTGSSSSNKSNSNNDSEQCEDCSKCPETCNDNKRNQAQKMHDDPINDFDGWTYRGDESSPSILDISDEELARRADWFITVVTSPLDVTGISSLYKWVAKKFFTRQISRQTLRGMVTYAKNRQIYRGQSHFSKEIAEKYFQQMKSGNFNNYETLSALLDKSGRTIMTGGNHRMNAAIRYGVETGNFQIVDKLLKATRITQGEASQYGYKILNIAK